MAAWITVGWHWAIIATIQSSVLVGFLWIVMTVTRHRLDPRWVYLLWLLVFVRLAIPWTPASPTSLYNLLPRPARIELGGSPVHLNRTVQVVERGSTSVSTTGHTTPLAPALPLEMGAALWITGVAFFASRTVRAERQFRRSMHSAYPVTDPRILAVLTKHAAPGQITVWETPAVDTPSVYGLSRLRILFPPGLIDALTDEQVAHIVLHELSHVRRRDTLSHVVVMMLCSLYWFNPAIWIAYRHLRAAEELAADHEVLRELPPNATLQYGRTLLRLLEFRAHRSPRTVTIVGMSLHTSLHERRITMIRLYPRAIYRWFLPAALAGIGIAVATMAMAPASPSSPSPQVVATGQKAPEPNGFQLLKYPAAGITSNRKLPIIELKQLTGALGLPHSFQTPPSTGSYATWKAWAVTQRSWMRHQAIALSQKIARILGCSPSAFTARVLPVTFTPKGLSAGIRIDSIKLTVSRAQHLPLISMSIFQESPNYNTPPN